MTLPLDRVLLQASPVLPVLVIEDVALAPDLARALYAGGVTVLEVTLRTPQALDAIAAIHREVPEVLLGAGTLIHTEQFLEARDAGAQFAVSPGCTPRLAAAAEDAGLPYLPGVMTPSEVLLALEYGYRSLKLFPVRWHCQRENAEKPEGAVHRHPLLPDRRGQPGQPAEFPPPAQCRLCRRHLAGAAEPDPGAGLGSDHTTGQGSARTGRQPGAALMNWDYADPFVIDLRVLAEDIDGLGHANNAVYVSWLERCAWRHSQRLGLDLAEYRRLDRAMAVLRHEIDYLAAAYEGDELQLATWIVESDQRLRMNRRFQLVRPADGATLLRAQTTFVCIELSSGKPKRMPAEFIDGYGQALLAGA